MDFSRMSPDEMVGGAFPCACGKTHVTDLSFLKVGREAVRSLPEAMSVLGVRRPFIVSDYSTHRSAWPHLQPVLERSGIPYTSYILPFEAPEPDEKAVGSLAMAFNPDCDVFLAVGSGVINDCCKVLSHAVGRKQIVLCTAPSMDGYASASSSMVWGGVKVTLYNAAPAAILADTDIMKNAPMRLLQAGLGDMLAKYVSVCEWRLSNLITGEYYCENIAALVRRSLQKVVEVSEGLISRNEDSVRAAAEGLILSGIAMTMAEVSRPASGIEHYFSHIWEMMALDRGQKSDLHGIQVGVGTCLALKIFDLLRSLNPDRARAERFVRGHSDADWEARMKDIFGSTAESLIRKEREEYHQNDVDAHAIRLERILSQWPQIQQVIADEIPPTSEVIQRMTNLGLPTTPADLGVSHKDTLRALHGSRNIRDKYLTSSLLWDLGILYETCLD